MTDRAHTHRRPPALALITACLSLAPPALAQQPETRDQPPAPPSIIRNQPRSVPVINGMPRGAFHSVQVNVDENGMNIVGDAGNEPSLAVDPTAPNRIAIGWRQFDSINSNFRQAGYAYSRDGGRTWTFAGRIEAGIFRSDPVLEADSSGNFYYNSLMEDFTTQVFKSTDGGMTWPTFSQAFGGDKQWMVIDKSHGMGDGNIYEDWSTVAGPYTTMTFSRSIDFGASFQSPIAIPGPTTGGTLAIGPTGELYTASNSRFDKSLNARDRSVTPTFTTTTISLGGPGGSNGTPNPNPGGGLGQTWVDVDRSNGPRRGWIYVLQSVNPSGTDPLDVNFIRSTDGGQTWSTPVRVNNDSQSSTHWQWFGTMSVAPNGRIDAVWNDSRESNQSNMVRLYYAYSNDGGTTWLGNIPVGPVWNSFIGWPQQNKIGDYYDMESDLVGANVAYAATYNGEQDVYFLRIGDYDCNGNGIPDTQDIAADPSLDCNGNGIPDSCEIAAGTVTDVNHDGVPDTCECLVDWNHDGVVNSSDFFAFVNAFFAGDADFNISGTTNSQDFFDFLNGFFAGC